MNLRQTGRYILDRRNETRKRPLLKAGNVSYANWWSMDPASYWFTRFIRHYYPDVDREIRFYSVFGPKNTIDEPFDGVKIFFSGENLEEGIPYERLRVREVSEKIWADRRARFGDYAAGRARLSMGFPEKVTSCEAEGTRYLRFPLWITGLFEPEDDLSAMKQRIEEINHIMNPSSARGIACIASHDFFGTRTDICDKLESAGLHVEYAGAWRHNTDDLKKVYNDIKCAYLHTKRVNICPENLDTPGYVTEKLFDAFLAGTIPVYHGSVNRPEEGLINREAVLFWDYDSDNAGTIRQIEELTSDNQAYLDYTRQMRLFTACAEYAWDRILVLRKELDDLL